jgi:hypothetical protein
MSRSMNRFGVPAAGLLAIALLAGCGGSGGLDTGAASSGSATSGSPSGAAPAASPTDPATGSTSPTAAPSSSATPTVDAAAAAVRADYARYHAGYVKSIRTRDTHVPDAISYATAKRQEVVSTLISFIRSSNLLNKGNARDWTKDVTVVGRRATLRYCEFDSSSYYVYASTGRKYTPVKEKWNAHSVALLLRDDRWQVDSIAFSKFSCKGAS